jgi:hypothetical protein
LTGGLHRKKSGRISATGGKWRRKSGVSISGSAS